MLAVNGVMGHSCFHDCSQVGGYDGVCDEEEYDDHSEVGNLEFLKSMADS